MWNSFRDPANVRGTGYVVAIMALLNVLTTVAQPVFPEINSRQQAISALERPDPRDRATAIAYLGRTALATDAPLLIKRLADENPLIRDLAEQNIWRVWSRSGDARIDQLLEQGVAHMTAGDHTQAIKIFTRVIESKPGFAEGWNKRATAYFLAGELQKSLADCDQVMKRNPQHFGALSGYGQIYLRLDELDQSLAYFRRALTVNPNMSGVEINIRAIEELRREKRRRTI